MIQELRLVVSRYLELVTVAAFNIIMLMCQPLLQKIAMCKEPIDLWLFH